MQGFGAAAMLAMQHFHVHGAFFVLLKILHVGNKFFSHAEVLNYKYTMLQVVRAVLERGRYNVTRGFDVLAGLYTQTLNY